MTISNVQKFLQWVILILTSCLLLLLLLRPQCIRLDQSIYFNRVKRNISGACDAVENDQKRIREIISPSSFSFSVLNAVKSDNPFYIFNEGRLVYWSASESVPLYNSVKGEYRWNYISTNSGKSIVCRDVLRKKEIVYEVYSLIPLENNYAVENQFVTNHKNESIFGAIPVRIYTANKVTPTSLVRNHVYLFNYEFYSDDQNYLYGTVCTFIYVLLLTLLWVYVILLLWRNTSSVFNSPAIRLTAVISLRSILLYINLPQFFSDNAVFSSGYYASSFLSRSVFDLVLNVLCALYIVYEFTQFIKRRQFYKYIYINQKQVHIYIKCAVFISLLWVLFHSYYWLLKSIVLNSTISLNLIEELDFSFIRYVLVFAILCLSSLYFYLIHLTLHALWRLNKRYRIHLWKELLFFYLIFISVTLFMDNENRIITFCLILFSLLTLYQNYPPILGKMRYQSFIYLFLFAICSSFLIGTSIYYNGRSKMSQQMLRFGERLLNDRDEITEFLLYDASKNIRKDVFIQEKILSPFSDLTIVKEKIQKRYLSNYFIDYSIRVELLDAFGEPFNMQTEQFTFSDYYDKVLVKSKYIRQNDLYIYNDHISNTRKYISVNKIKSANSVIAYIIIELESGRYSKNRVFPELALDQKQYQVNSGDYDYGIIHNEKLETGNGYFNYDQRFINYFTQRAGQDGFDFRYQGYHHVVIRKDSTTWIVISEPYSIMDILISNASMYFLFHIVFVLFFILIHIFRIRSESRQISYATKVQIYLNLAFFIPLLLASFITLGFVNRNYETTLINRFIDASEKISTLISMRSISNNKIDIPSVSTLLQESDITRVEQLDINVYSPSGYLVSTNQPEVFRKGILSRYIHPVALASLEEGRNQYVITNEKAGKLAYKSVYRLIRVPGTGAIAGIVHLPFFESKEEISNQITTYLRIILNIFSIGFIILLLLSYMASFYLTYPLKLITQGIRKTGLDDNEPINWKSSDEIGRLVQEYNTMLLKLDDSKAKLASSEKESAWREMARQVAHEIKNPLTPMKLKLQYLLQRLNNSQTKPDDEELKQSFRTMLMQVDTLSEIAGSFSSFYTLPDLYPEKLDLNELIKEIVAFHQQNDQSGIVVNVPDHSNWVYADKTMFVNVLNNLIINAIQSIPSAKKRRIVVTVTKAKENILIEIRDNGLGIPVDVQHKIFVPYFSTKYSGSGIGLALAKRLVEDMKGNIWFETIPGEGTSFFIELPAIKE